MEKIIWGAPSFWIERFPLYWGLHKGFFKDQGMNLDIWYSFGGPELARAVTQGRIHIGEMGLPPFITAYQKGLPARIIGSSVIQQLDHYLAARPSISAITDLAGSRIGILSPGSCDDYFIRKMLTAHHLDPQEDVTLVALNDTYGDLALFAEGELDAAFLVEPQLSQGEMDGLVRVIGRVGDFYPSYQWGIILASNLWIEQKRELLQRLMHAFRQACQSIKADPNATIAVGSEVFGVSPEVFQRALERDLPRWQVDARVDESGLKNALKLQEAMGASASNPDLKKMICQL